MPYENAPSEPFTRQQVVAVPDHRMLSLHGGSGYRDGSSAVIKRSISAGAAADEHWMVLQCGNATVKVRIDVTVWSTQPSGEPGNGAEQEHSFTVAFPEGVLYVDQGTIGIAAEIPLPRAGSYHLRVQGWNHHAVMREAQDIELQAADEDWDLDRMGEELEKLDGKERYAVDLWPTH
ncbi:hypothetical protein LP52_15275 [Streptomonospora alba]|uniref:Uncharacterized protein n=1 Tax=Streptomonospora alba TaxID=183763 RepID=A0A0C2FFP4_9ACTN|nr:hypothetical protein [Streptomonospora alba]KIH98064.1 hypothetical protein LP52_15275 [Streptomonospora alba]